MFANVNRFLAIIVVGIKQQLAYKKDYFISLVFRVFSSLIMIAVWSAVYLNTNVTSIGGFTLPQMYVYFFLINAITFMSINEPIADSIQSDIQDGTITTALIRPMTYTAQIFFNSFSNQFFSGLVVTIPFMILITFLAHLALTPLNLALFVAEIAMSFAVSTLLFFLIGTIAIYLANIWGIIAVTESVYFLLGGAIVPLNLLPYGLGNIFMLFPMQLALYTPAATLLGLLTIGQITQSLAVGAAWTAVLLLISFVVWRKVSVNMTSVGG
jgi:ABC-2 type transport system permease protein